MTYENIIGRKYNKLLVISEIKKQCSDRVRYYVECKCDCGNTCFVEKSKVKSGYTKSCGCKQTTMRKTLGKRSQLPNGQSVFNEVYSSYKKSAKLRSYSFELTQDEFREVITQPCIYCGETKRKHYSRDYSNGNFEYTGIDRVDNKKGYIKDNVVPCCSSCNRMKTNMSLLEFKNKITKIYNRLCIS